jgi:hypothetical protein
MENPHSDWPPEEETRDPGTPALRLAELAEEQEQEQRRLIERALW